MDGIELEGASRLMSLETGLERDSYFFKNAQQVQRLSKPDSGPGFRGGLCTVSQLI